MAAMRTVGCGHRLPAHANDRKDDAGYVLELDDADRDHITVFRTRGTIELHVFRTTLEPRRVPIEPRSPYASNPGAEPC